MKFKRVSYSVDVYRSTGGASSASGGLTRVGPQTKTGYVLVEDDGTPVASEDGTIPVLRMDDVITAGQIR